MLRKVLFLTVLMLAAQIGLADAQERTITVIGEGRADVQPDMATVQLGVVTEAPGAREAIDTNSRAMAAVLDRLKAAGIEDRDLQTSNFSVDPRWGRQVDNTPPKVTGFVAQNMLSVRVRDLDRLGAVLDEVARDGANSFNGLSFGLQDPSEAQNAARRDAVAKARALAALYAEAAGVTLGPLLSLSESGGGGYPMPMARAEMAMASDAVPVAAGEVSLSARVTLVYAIAD
jgi:uncharacterized protein YggE